MGQSIAGMSVHEQVGGTAFFERLVDRFYEGVADDPVLLPLYPDAPDLGPARHRLTLFLVQYWGGPTTYSDQRVHPRLRMRHAPFVIAEAEREAWMDHMTAAVATMVADGSLADDDAARMLGYFAMAAQHMVNAEG